MSKEPTYARWGLFLQGFSEMQAGAQNRFSVAPELRRVLLHQLHRIIYAIKQKNPETESLREWWQFLIGIV